MNLHVPGSPLPIAMSKEEGGYWCLRLEGFSSGDRYAFSVDGAGPFPDPASRFQPDGVHGFSQAWMPAHDWKHPNPPISPPARRSIYELHIGTFTPEGTFDSARCQLPRLRDLGVTLLELMPLADFPGRWNWGYDGASLFAPARCYGTPESLCRLIDDAHGLGLGVLLDVVYNHLGPDGNYLGIYSKRYYNPEKHTPWGAALNFDGPGSSRVRRFFLDNILHWLRDYRFDGLRLDATHAIHDESDDPFLGRVALEIKAELPERGILIYAEDHRNANHFCLAPAEGGHGFDGVWADDLHHHLRRRMAGDNEGYFAGFDGSPAAIAATLERGWYRDGSVAEGLLSQGTDASRLDYDKFVVCLQNHDQVGNRALGERLNQQIAPAGFRAVSALLLLAPETPLLFMGQEWGSSSPFRFFTDHNPELGRLVTEGRRKEFSGFSAFSLPESREAIPDPQDGNTFLRSKLLWEETDMEPHASVLRFHRRLLSLRGAHPALGSTVRGSMQAAAQGDSGLYFIRRSGGHAMSVAICLEDKGGTLRVPPPPGGGVWMPVMTSEEEPVASEGCLPMEVAQEGGGWLRIRFARAGAWIGDASETVSGANRE